MGKKTRKRPRWRRLSFEYINEERPSSPAEDEQTSCDQSGHDQTSRCHAVSTHMFDENEYTKIQTPRQDMIFKKNVLSNRPRDNSPPVSMCDELSCCEECIGEGGFCDPSSCPYPYSPYPAEYCGGECCQGGPYVPFPAAPPYLPNVSVPPPPLMLDVPEQQVLVHLQPLAAGEHLSFTSTAKGSVVSAAAAAVAHQVVLAARGRVEDADSVEDDNADGNEGVSDSEICREEDEASLAKLLAEIQYAFIDPHGNIFCNVMDDAGMIHLPAVAGYHMARPFPGGPVMATPVPWQAVAIAPLASPSYRLLQYMSAERIRQLQQQLEARILLQCHHFQQLLLVEHQRQLHTRFPLPPTAQLIKHQLDPGFIPESPQYYHAGGSVDENCFSESSNSDDHVTVTTTTPIDFTRVPPPPLCPVTPSSTSGVVSMSDNSDLMDAPTVTGPVPEDPCLVEVKETESLELDKTSTLNLEEDSVPEKSDVTGDYVRDDVTTDKRENDESKGSNYKSRRMKKKKKKRQKKKAKKCAENSPVRRSIDSGIIDEGSDASRESSQQASADTASSINSDPAMTSTGHSQSGQTSGIQSDISASSSPPHYSSDSEEDTLLLPATTSQQLSSLAQNLHSFSALTDDMELQLSQLSNKDLQLMSGPVSDEQKLDGFTRESSNTGEVLSVPFTEPLTSLSNSSSFSNESNSSGTVVMEEITPTFQGKLDSECAESGESPISYVSDEVNGEGEESCDSIIFDSDPTAEDEDSWNGVDPKKLNIPDEQRVNFPIGIDLKKTVILEETESEQESLSHAFSTRTVSDQELSESSVEPESNTNESESCSLVADPKTESDRLSKESTGDLKQEKSEVEDRLEEQVSSSSLCVLASTQAEKDLSHHENCEVSSSLPRVLAEESAAVGQTVTTVPSMPISEAIRSWVSLQSPEELFSAVAFQSEDEGTEDDAEPGCDSCSEAIEWDESRSLQHSSTNPLSRQRRAPASNCSIQ